MEGKVGEDDGLAIMGWINLSTAEKVVFKNILDRHWEMPQMFWKVYIDFRWPQSRETFWEQD